jgi:hypothetical protein
MTVCIKKPGAGNQILGSTGSNPFKISRNEQNEIVRLENWLTTTVTKAQGFFGSCFVFVKSKMNGKPTQVGLHLLPFTYTGRNTEPGSRTAIDLFNARGGCPTWSHLNPQISMIQKRKGNSLNVSHIIHSAHNPVHTDINKYIMKFDDRVQIYGHCQWMYANYTSSKSHSMPECHKSLHCQILILVILTKKPINLDCRRAQSGRSQHWGHQNVNRHECNCWPHS